MESVQASLWAEDVGDIISKLPFMVNEYANVFSNELLGLPPDKEVDFGMTYFLGLG